MTHSLFQPGVKEEFLNVFYQHFIKLLLECLKRKNNPNYNKAGSPKTNGNAVEAKSDEESKEAPNEEKKDGTEESPKGEPTNSQCN